MACPGTLPPGGQKSSRSVEADRFSCLDAPRNQRSPSVCYTLSVPMADTSDEKKPTPRSLTKADIVAGVAKRLHFTQVQAAIVVDSFLKGVVSALKSGEEVEIRGLGSFRRKRGRD